jgi:hypothetical protein
MMWELSRWQKESFSPSDAPLLFTLPLRLDELLSDSSSKFLSEPVFRRSSSSKIYSHSEIRSDTI